MEPLLRNYVRRFRVKSSIKEKHAKQKSRKGDKNLYPPKKDKDRLEYLSRNLFFFQADYYDPPRPLFGGNYFSNLQV